MFGHGLTRLHPVYVQDVAEAIVARTGGCGHLCGSVSAATCLAWRC